MKLVTSTYVALLSKVISKPPRKITDDERQHWLDEIVNSPYGIHDAKVLLTAASAHVLEVTVEHIHALFVLPNAYAPPRLLAKLRRALARVAALGTTSLVYILVPCPRKRFWPSDVDEPIKPTHINGAFTYRNGSHVFVFREEEFPKVMLHEAIHHSHFDPSLSVLGGVEHLFRSKFNIAPTTTLLIGEGVVESFATHMQAQYVAYDNQVSFDRIWKHEMKWMELQANHLLLRLTTSKNAWIETTNAFAYILVRWLCCQEFDELARLIVAKQPLLPFFEKALIQTPNRMHKQTSTSLRLTVFGDF